MYAHHGRRLAIFQSNLRPRSNTFFFTGQLVFADQIPLFFPPLLSSFSLQLTYFLPSPYVIPDSSQTSVHPFRSKDSRLVSKPAPHTFPLFRTRVSFPTVLLLRKVTGSTTFNTSSLETRLATPIHFSLKLERVVVP